MATVIPINSIRKSRSTLHDRLVAAYCRKLQPKGELELSLVEQFAHAHWRLMVYRSKRPGPPDDSPDGATALTPKAA